MVSGSTPPDSISPKRITNNSFTHSSIISYVILSLPSSCNEQFISGDSYHCNSNSDALLPRTDQLYVHSRLLPSSRYSGGSLRGTVPLTRLPGVASKNSYKMTYTCRDCSTKGAWMISKVEPIEVLEGGVICC